MGEDQETRERRNRELGNRQLTASTEIQLVVAKDEEALNWHDRTQVRVMHCASRQNPIGIGNLVFPTRTLESPDTTNCSRQRGKEAKRQRGKECSRWSQLQSHRRYVVDSIRPTSEDKRRVEMTTSFKPDFSITNGITKGLTRIERARGFLEAATLSERWVRKMGRRALILEAHHTTHIEGTRLTLAQAERLLEGDSVPEANPDDVRELLNYREAFEFVSEYLEDGGPITEGLVRQIHKYLVEGVRGGTAAPGEYRKVQNYVVNSVTGETVYTPPPAHDVPIMMAELVSWLNQNTQTHPVLASGIAQFQLVHIHPFLDGNGRTSRLLSTLCLYRAGYDFKRLFTISEYYDRDRTAFYRAIQRVRDSGMDMTGWLEYFVEGLATQLAEIRRSGEQVIRRDILVGEYGLSDRQANAIGHILENGSLTIQDFERLCPNISRRSLQRDLQAMIQKGVLVEKSTSPTDPSKRYMLARHGPR